MKIIEAMKELKLILKKINKNTQLINEYAALPDNERMHFGTKENQSKELKKLIQSNIDHTNNYMRLKSMIEYTNLMTKVEIDGEVYTISEMLVLKRVLSRMMVKTYNALNDDLAQMKLRSSRPTSSSEKSTIVEKFYNESEKTEGQRKWDDLYHTIDSRLEVINATTELLDIQELKESK